MLLCEMLWRFVDVSPVSKKKRGKEKEEKKRGKEKKSMGWNYIPAPAFIASIAEHRFSWIPATVNVLLE